MSIDTKTALLNSAERAARRLGFDGFSYADLAKEVGIRKASIHYHFPSKADLSLALMTRYREGFRAICKEIDAQDATGAGRLHALVSRYFEALEGAESLCLCVAFSVSRDSLSEETTAQMGQFRAMMLQWLEAVFALGVEDGTITGVHDPKLEAAAVLPLLEGAQLTARAGRNVALFTGATAILLDRAQ